MKKVKIIHLLCHIPPKSHLHATPEDYFTSPGKGKYQILNYPPYWVGFFIDHNVFAARDLMDLTNEFDVECWRPYGHGLKEPREEIVSGIKHRVFPAHQISFPQFGSLTWSNELFEALLWEIRSNKIILNISVGHAWFHIKLMIKLRNLKHKFGLVALHRSGGFRNFSYSQLNPWKKIVKWYYLLESEIDAYSLQFCDVYYIGAKPEAVYVKTRRNKIPGEFFMEGIDFSKYRVLKYDQKIELRSRLGLPLHKKLFIVYGNWISTDYAYQHLLEVFREIKSTNDGNDLELIMIGGNKTQDLYEIAVKSGAIMIERVDKASFINYMEASDFFGQTCFSWSFINFGGFGTAMVEALACGLPIISGNIIHLPGSEEEMKQIGLGMKDKEELKKNIIYMKNNIYQYTKCREIARKYYDLNATRTVLLNKYRELATKYFNEDTASLNSIKDN